VGGRRSWIREDISIRIHADGEERASISALLALFRKRLGSNAARVTKLIEEINSAVDKQTAAEETQTPANCRRRQ